MYSERRRTLLKFNSQPRYKCYINFLIFFAHFSNTFGPRFIISRGRKLELFWWGVDQSPAAISICQATRGWYFARLLCCIGARSNGHQFHKNFGSSRHLQIHVLETKTHRGDVYRGQMGVWKHSQGAARRFVYRGIITGLQSQASRES